MKRKLIPCLLALALSASLAPSALAAAPPPVCYPVSVTRSEDGAEIRKVYELGPDEDPAGIPRSDFEQEGCYYTLTDLLKQEAPEHEERFHTETVTVASKSKDMESVLALLPAQREFTTDDGLTGILSLKLDTVNVEVSGYGSSTKTVSATRTYPNLAGQDTSFIPKEITDNGRTLELASIDWRTDSTTGEDGDRYTAVATYTGSATSSYVKGYTVTADYSGTVSRITLNKVRYVAIFEGTPLNPVIPVEPEPDLGSEPTPEPTPEPAPEPSPGEQVPAAPIQFHWAYVLAPLGVVALAGAGLGAALFIKKHKENDAETEDDTE
ncbi:MAG: cell wall anchor protein [Oscillospiraceae bacterium]|nr:cell wall anchor protein [Oscillospiraceae bacterium]